MCHPRAKGLAHMIIEAEKSHHLPSASWRPRKAGGVIQVQTQRPENQSKSPSELEGLRTKNTDIWRQDKIDILVQRENSFLHHLPLLRHSNDRMWPTDVGGRDLLYSVYWIKHVSPFQSSSQTHSEIVFYQPSEHLLAQLTHKINHHSM